MQQKARKGKSRGKVMCLGNLPYKQCQSALKHLFHMRKYYMELNFIKHFKQFTKGIWHHITDKKELKGYANNIGKKMMGFHVYKKF
jgi:hypothetical protein